MNDDHWLERLAELDADVAAGPAPARLVSQVYSAVVERLSESGPLLDLARSTAAGARLCVFERAVALIPAGSVRSMNPCRICHARVLGERMEHAPIFWPGCPYAEFHKG